MDVLMQIIDAAMDCKLDRKSVMIALGTTYSLTHTLTHSLTHLFIQGGGVIGDMTGFAASIYQRGIKFIQIPTTLMAMVDSAVGGKTAVNHPKGKNMIGLLALTHHLLTHLLTHLLSGAFYQPDCVIVDTSTLNSLPDRELRSGIAEVIKYGLIRDPSFFKWQEENMNGMFTHSLLLTNSLTHSYSLLLTHS